MQPYRSKQRIKLTWALKLNPTKAYYNSFVFVYVRRSYKRLDCVIKVFMCLCLCGLAWCGRRTATATNIELKPVWGECILPGILYVYIQYNARHCARLHRRADEWSGMVEEVKTRKTTTTVKRSRINQQVRKKQKKKRTTRSERAGYLVVSTTTVRNRVSFTCFSFFVFHTTNRFLRTNIVLR